jgi:hypothetical protein
MVHAGGYLNGNKPFEPAQVEMIYWLANFPEQPILFPYSVTQSTSDWQHLDRLISRVETAPDFPMTPDEKKCNYCSYRSYCDRGIAASISDDQLDEPQLEVADLILDNIQEIEF